MGEEDEMRICKADIEDHLPPFWNVCLVITVIVNILAESTNIHSNEALCLAISSLLLDSLHAAVI